MQSPESVTPPPSAPAIKINVSLAIKRLMNLENAAHRASLTNCASMPTPMCRDHTVWCPGEIRPLVGWFDDPLRSCSRATQRAHIQYSSPRCRFVGVLLNVRVLAQTHLHAIALVGAGKGLEGQGVIYCTSCRYPGNTPSKTVLDLALAQGVIVATVYTHVDRTVATSLVINYVFDALFR